MVFHCLSIPYAPTRKEISLCAFVQKVYKFCDEMTKRGHIVYHYGHENSKVNCTEHITVTNDDILKTSYDNLNSWQQIGFDQNVETKAFEIFNQNCITEIKKRLKTNKDFIMCWFGFGHLKSAETFQNRAIVVEPSIGYDSMFAPIKIFETKSQMHKLYGAAQSNINFGKDYVVYPGFDKNDFTYKSEKSSYAVFLGRIVEPKGAKLAYDICNNMKQEIYFLGPNILKLKDTKYCKFVGFVDPIKRNEYLSSAKFLLAPSLFTEPCNWTAIESQFCGTPVICSGFGGFSETVVDERTGFQCMNIRSIISSIQSIKKINPLDCYDHATSHFTLQKQCESYEKIFKSII